MIRYELRDIGPEAGLVMPVPQVDKFVDYNVFEEFRVSHNQPPIESQRPIRAAASPAALLFPDEHRPGDETGAKRPISGHRCECFDGSCSIPADDCRANNLGMSRRIDVCGRLDHESCSLEPDSRAWTNSVLDLEIQGLPKVGQGLAAHQTGRRGRWNRFSQPGEDPLPV
jgi:hypothetical protein